MTDNTKMVDLPWIDGTTRTVPEETPYVMRDGYLAYARDGGYSYAGGAGRILHDHDDDSAAVRILTEAPEPPVKVDVPTGLGAVVSSAVFPDNPGFVLTRDGWRGLHTYTECHPSEIADRLRDGARVLYEGVDE
ncbi:MULTISPECIES: hypothetical protein [Micrococcales]|uniref:hypothetical protein n=1 Tax=Micrococcales TaxID=85006 RepID=UPI002592D665|nr:MULTISPECIES: hypothetical protein [Micrococcales]